MASGALNNPVGFEQDPESPPGTGTFHFEDGSKLFAMEPELAQKISASAGPQMATTPAAAKPRDAWYDDPADPVARPGETRADFTTRAERLQAEAAPKDLPALPTGGGGSGQPQAVPTTGPDGRIMPAINPMKYVPGVNPQAMRAGAVPVPQTTSTVVEQGTPYDPQMARMREAMNQGVVGAKLAEFESVKQQHLQQAAATAASIPKLREQEAAAKADLARKEDAYTQERNRVHQYIADYDRTARVDPAQIFKAGYGFPALAMVIGQAFGAYAATLAGGSNFAQQAASEIWQTNLQTQREQIQQGRVGNDNMLARLKEDFGGDLEKAESAWKIMHSELLDREIQSYQEGAKSAAVDQAAGVWLAQNKQERFNEEQKLYNLSLGKATTTQSEKFITPQRGGYRPKTREEILKELKQEREFQGELNQYNTELRGGKASPQEAKAQLEGRKEEIAFGDKWRDTNGGAAAIEDYARAMGLKIDWDTGEVHRPEGDLPGVGIIDSNINPTDAAQNVQQRQQKAVQRYRQAMSGAAFTPQEAKEYSEVVTGGWGTERGALRGLEMMVNDIRENRRYLRSTYGDEVYERYREKERDVNRGDVRRSQDDAEPKGKPY